MSIAENKAAARRYVEAHSAVPRTFDVLDEVADPDVTWKSPGWPEIHGLENLKKHLGSMYRSAADFETTVDAMVGEGDEVVVRWTASLTTSGPLPLPIDIAVPAGKTVTWSGVSIFRLRGGKVVEERVLMDWLAVLRQLGALPAL